MQGLAKHKALRSVAFWVMFLTGLALSATLWFNFILEQSGLKWIAYVGMGVAGAFWLLFLVRIFYDIIPSSLQNPKIFV